jgi:O-acetyl-ADP-ribose deacetylase (regulator of RNase III)
MKVVQGDLLTMADAGHFDVVVHGCNCRGIMGGGIAAQVAKRWPEAAQADRELSRTSKADDMLGTIGFVQRDALLSFVIVNGYTQLNPGACADYEAIRLVFREVKQRLCGKRIGYPKIGAGIGGGDWNVISQIIEEELAGEDHTLVEYQP